MKIPQDFQLAIQFLEPCPQVCNYDPTRVKAKLKTALTLLPISILIIGWDIPTNFVDICREEATKRGIKLYRWQPLLTSDGELPVREAYRVIGLNGNPIPGFNNMPSFTFMCSSHKQFREQILAHLADLLRPGIFDGIFFDRMRFPALTQDLNASLSCFCPSCKSAAEKVGLNLTKVKSEINPLIATTKGRREFLRSILAPVSSNPISESKNHLRQYFNFRTKSITGIVKEATQLAHKFGVDVGLDCFSPSLSWSVGQDMHGLGTIGDWIKPMSYIHTFAPAGLPFELNELCTLMGKTSNHQNFENLNFLSHTMGFPLPESQKVLMERGLASIVLEKEITKAKLLTSKPILEGIELVDIPGITHIEQNQLHKDMKALMESPADGIVISWDLWHIEIKNLQTIADIIHSQAF